MPLTATSQTFSVPPVLVAIFGHIDYSVFCLWGMSLVSVPTSLLSPPLCPAPLLFLYLHPDAGQGILLILHVPFDSLLGSHYCSEADDSLICISKPEITSRTLSPFA